MRHISIPTRSGSDWQHLLAKPERHWKAGKSAMCAAASWEAAGDRLPTEIAAALDACQLPEVANLKLLAAMTEWEVPLPGGATSSYTDVLAIARNEVGLCVIAVEAKANDDFGELLAEKRREASTGQLERIAYLERTLGVPSFDGQIRYQLLHRTVSALLTAADFHAGAAVMLIQSFGNRPEVKADFERFCEAMGSRKLSDGVHLVQRFTGPKLVLAWCDGDPQCAVQELPWDPVLREASKIKRVPARGPLTNEQRALLALALAELTGDSMDKIRGFLASKREAEKAALLGNPRVRRIFDRLATEKNLKQGER